MVLLHHSWWDYTNGQTSVGRPTPLQEWGDEWGVGQNWLGLCSRSLKWRFHSKSQYWRPWEKTLSQIGDNMVPDNSAVKLLNESHRLFCDQAEGLWTSESSVGGFQISNPFAWVHPIPEYSPMQTYLTLIGDYEYNGVHREKWGVTNILFHTSSRMSGKYLEALKEIF